MANAEEMENKELNPEEKETKELNPEEMEATNGGNFFTDLWDKTMSFAVDTGAKVTQAVDEALLFGAQEAGYLKCPAEMKPNQGEPWDYAKA